MTTPKQSNDLEYLLALLAQTHTDLQRQAACSVDSEIGQTLSDLSSPYAILSSVFSLGWSHYVNLLLLANSDERKFYQIEAAANSWSVRIKI
jgi:hypothetical protein